MQQDRRDATNIKEFIQSQCQNPFDLENIPSTLMNITTGQVATPEVEKSLIGATEKGQKATDEFFAEQIDEGSSGSFWDPLPRCPVVTFSSMKKALSYDKDRKLIIDTEILFRRLLSVSKNREVDMRSVLSFELAAVPPSLFHDDGSIRKTTKAVLTKKLEESCTNVITELPEILPICSSVYIIDGMAMIQSLNESHFKTFNDLAEIVQKRILRILRNPSMAINQVSVIFDRYDHPNSIKTNERTRRGAANACTVATHEIQGTWKHVKGGSRLAVDHTNNSTSALLMGITTCMCAQRQLTCFAYYAVSKRVL
ncbi:hypothetical protein GQR58_006054 [Nymphon striatum]|nr:hypothetical protein GQR58_006054 [Nymphon striatum]